ncbi:HAD-IIIA family hydrolase [Treponema vincentii]|uniref:HAD-IIIA family hydrolase n=1 Tax=Treponema vincentii TaxID=69710 RepID=UPI0020A3936F|nr:HAD-IIIA family hydrolase [Treponema vincentii]UTC60840.1 HAD-IIIA family hydrolase [Treponema vincentii]
MKAIILAGGKGTRIASIRSDIPKPMIELCGKPILQYQIENLRSFGLTDITLVIGYLGDVIKNYFGSGSQFGVNISYFVEPEPLGTAGALFKMSGLTEDFLLLCGDIIFDVDFARFITFHNQHTAWASLMSHPNSHPYDSSLLITEILPPNKLGGLPYDSHKVIQWLNKEDERVYYKNRVNAGIQIISPKLLESAKDILVADNNVLPDKIDLDRGVLKPNIANGRIFAYDTPEYIKDMGTPDRYYQTEADIKSGLLQSRNLIHEQKAVFLDRDGTINEENGFISHPDDFILLSDAAEAIKMINQSGYLAIVITNQPVIARGECSFDSLQLIHNKMETELGKSGAFIDGLYFCPHHTDKGFEGERLDYKCICDCRKPKPGLLLQAAEDFNIDMSSSYMVGDSASDLVAGKNAGCKASVLVSERYSLLDFVKDYLSKN